VKDFYTYLWLREDGTPYYVGKGTGYRWSKKHRVGLAPPKERIIIYPAESENDAFETEIALIWYYGRKDLGLGCLRNISDGGEGGPSGSTRPEEVCRRISEKMKGVPKTKRARANMKRSEAFKENLRTKMLGNKNSPGWPKGKPRKKTTWPTKAN
jgi:hypothetical protein